MFLDAKSISSTFNSSNGSDISIDDLLQLLYSPLSNKYQDYPIDKPPPLEEEFITITQFIVAITHILLPSEFRNNLVELENINQTPAKSSRIRKTKRMQSNVTGDVGGKKTISDTEFATRIQSIFRAWSVILSKTNPLLIVVVSKIFLLLFLP